MTGLEQEFEHWFAISKSQTATLMEQWAAAGRAISIVISAAGHIERNIPQNLAPREFRKALQRGKNSLRRALDELRESGQEFSMAPVALEPRIELSWGQMRDSLSRLMGHTSDLQNFRLRDDVTGSPHVTDASKHFRVA